MTVYVPSVDVSTLPPPTFTLQIVSKLSLQFAQNSVYTAFFISVSGSNPTRLITGGVVSSTITVLVTSVAALSELSMTLYEIVYVPRVFISTGFMVSIFAVIFPSSLSFAVAHASR